MQTVLSIWVTSSMALSKAMAAIVLQVVTNIKEGSITVDKLAARRFYTRTVMFTQVK